MTGTLTPALGALLHNGTTIGVCLNAMRDPHDADWDLGRTLQNVSHALDAVKKGIDALEGNDAEASSARYRAHGPAADSFC